MYKRVSDVADKIKDAKLKIEEWKVLFAVDGNSSEQKIAEFLELSYEKVGEALNSLSENGYITKGDADVAEVPVAEETEEAVTATEPVQEPVDEFANLVDEAQSAFEENAPKEATDDDSTPAEEPAETAAEEELIIEEQQEEPLFEEIIDEPAETPEPEEEIILDDTPEESSELLVEESPVADKTEAAESEPEAVINLIDDKPEESDAASLLDDAFTETPVTEAPPVAETAAEPEVVAQEPPATTSGDGNKILVVDDSIVIRKMVEIALEHEPYVIETAVSGKEALEKVDAFDPSLVILDIMLPDVSGIEILKAIKASKGVPVIMLSGKNSPQDIELASAQGADDFAPKPFKEDDLVQKIKKLL
jgi:CheY-like chemotaxis protein